MPFSVKRYGTRVKMNKMKRCVKSVKAKTTKVNPYAVCRASIYKKKSTKSINIGKPYKTSKWLKEHLDIIVG